MKEVRKMGIGKYSVLYQDGGIGRNFTLDEILGMRFIRDFWIQK